jgi:RNA-splicing ligase RtcB
MMHLATTASPRCAVTDSTVTVPRAWWQALRCDLTSRVQAAETASATGWRSTAHPTARGRAHSRSEARKAFTRESLGERMKGIEWGRSNVFLDEHSEACKDINVVMADAADLVRIEHTIRQLVNVKGG